MKTTSAVYSALALAGCLFLGGCVAEQANWERQSLIKQGQPAEYADGYADGFSSGEKAGGNIYGAFRKNVDRYITDARYKTGWDDGFASGKGQYESHTR